MSDEFGRNPVSGTVTFVPIAVADKSNDPNFNGQQRGIAKLWAGRWAATSCGAGDTIGRGRAGAASKTRRARLEANEQCPLLDHYVCPSYWLPFCPRSSSSFERCPSRALVQLGQQRGAQVSRASLEWPLGRLNKSRASRVAFGRARLLSFFDLLFLSLSPSLPSCALRHHYPLARESNVDKRWQAAHWSSRRLLWPHQRPISTSQWGTKRGRAVEASGLVCSRLASLLPATGEQQALRCNQIKGTQ